MKARSRTALDEHLPSRRDIRAACHEIQALWTDHERRKRAGLPREDHWNPPFVRSSQLGFEADNDKDV